MKRTEKMKMESSSDDEDSDVEKNFSLFTQKGGRGGGDDKQQHEEEEDEGDEEEDEGDEEEDEGEDDDEGDEEEEDEGEEDDEGDEEDEEEEGSEEEEDDDASDDDDDDGGSRDLQTSDDIKRELSHMSFEDVMKLQNQVGTKVYNEVAHGRTMNREKTTKRRLNKNRPMEISSKKPAPFLRQVVSVQKTTLRDPRFDDLSGEYKPEIFEKTYRFISDIKQKEKQVIQRQLKKMKKKNNQKKEKLQFLLKRMENQERARQSQEQRRERELQFKRQQRERANQGARPFFLKKSEKKKLHLAEKYEELKKSGKLENFLSKKRKRNAGKDRRKLPQRPQQHSNAARGIH